MQAATVSNGLAHLADKLVRDIHREAPAPPPAIERVVSMEFAGGAGRTLRANAAAPPQGNRPDCHWPQVSYDFDEPGVDIRGCLVWHVRMLVYMCSRYPASTFFCPSAGLVAGNPPRSQYDVQLSRLEVTVPYLVQCVLARRKPF